VFENTFITTWCTIFEQISDNLIGQHFSIKNYFNFNILLFSSRKSQESAINYYLNLEHFVSVSLTNVYADFYDTEKAWRLPSVYFNIFTYCLNDIR